MSPKLSETLRKDKPWAIMGISRKDWKTRRPWKAAKLTENAFAELIRMAGPEAIQAIREHADAEKLLEGVFGKDAIRDMDV